MTGEGEPVPRRGGATRTECDDPDVDDAETVDGVDDVVASIEDRARAVRDRELDEALTKLEARDDLSAADRKAVAGLADRLVERLVGVPESELREAAAAGDEETVETALELFG